MNRGLHRYNLRPRRGQGGEGNRSGPGLQQQGAHLRTLARNSKEFIECSKAMQDTIADHTDTTIGGDFSGFEIIQVQKVRNRALWRKYNHRKNEVARENGGSPDERYLFHGSPNVEEIVQNGFDERRAKMDGAYGAGIYFCKNSDRSNMFVYGHRGRAGCRTHGSNSCYTCERQLLLCRVTLGKASTHYDVNRIAHPPPGYHSVLGMLPPTGLDLRDYVVYRGEQAFPEYVITYKLIPPAYSNTAALRAMNRELKRRSTLQDVPPFWWTDDMDSSPSTGRI